MATEVKLPRLGQGMESGTIVRWLKSEGDQVRKNDPLYELDTDKVTQEVESDVEGVLLQIVVAEGEVDVGATIAVIGAAGEDGSAGKQAPAARVAAETADEGGAVAAPGEPGEAAPTEPVAATATGEPARATAPAERPHEAGAPASDGHLRASPLARRIARERGVDLARVVGTGPDGRIVAEDVERAAAGGPAPAAPPLAPAREAEVVELTTVRKTIARRLTEAWSAPVFQLAVSADMTEALALRERLVEAMHDGDAKPTINDVLVRLLAVSLSRHPAVNATFSDDRIHRYASANVGIAVAAPTGLVVPVIRGAERLTIQEIARMRADLVARARDGKLKLPDLEDGTFTLSNLGMYGVEQFTAVLNPPQVAILAVGAVVDEVVAVDGEIAVAPISRFVLTCDHRAIDGADGAEFLQTLVSLVEHPALAL